MSWQGSLIAVARVVYSIKLSQYKAGLELELYGTARYTGLLLAPKAKKKLFMLVLLFYAIIGVQ